MTNAYPKIEKNTSDNYTESILYASEIQKGLLPKERHFKKMGIDYAVWWEPHSVLSGDFYWTGNKDNCFYLAVADCTGHGISASLLTVMGISLLNYIILGKNFETLGEYLKELDKKWIETFQSETEHHLFNNDWMEIILMKIDTTNNIFEFAGAILSAVIKNNNDDIIVPPANPFPVGGWQIEKDRHFKSYQYPLEKGNEIFLFTDGIKDQFGGEKNKRFGIRNFRKLICETRSGSIYEKVGSIKETIRIWKGKNEQTDDITLIGLKVK